METPAGMRERWRPGDRPYFEYHCWESLKSRDARLWYRSHQRVRVLAGLVTDPPCLAVEMTVAERAEEACPGTYVIQFRDGFVGNAWEDELVTDPGYYNRPAPPCPSPQHRTV